MCLTIAYSKIKKKQNLVLINNATYQRETLSERPIQQTLTDCIWRELKDYIQVSFFTFRSLSLTFVMQQIKRGDFTDEIKF